MKKYLIISFCLILAVSCGRKRPPQGVLSEDEMVSVLVDIHMAEGFVQSLSIPYDSSRKLYPVLEKEIFEKHGITDSIYIVSLKYYLRDAAKMEAFYERTIDSLAVREKRALE